MSSCPQGPLESGGHVDASNQDYQMRTDRAAWNDSNRAGERQQYVFGTNLIYYSFTMSSAQCESRSPPRILTESVREASPAAGPDSRRRGNCNSAINAFLTLA